MNLIIRNPKAEYTDDFYHWLIDKIQLYAIANINNGKLVALNNYINNIPRFKSIFKKTFNAREILISFFYNLEIKKYWDRVVIESNINKIIPNSNAKIYNVVKLITYGTVHIKGYPIVTDTFKYFEDRIDDFYELYKRGL